MIDPAFLDRFARFGASLDRQVDAAQQGQQRSTETGEGRTFSGHRKYVPGDDTRLVDWRVYARTEELYVKQFEAERNLTVHVLVDASASMDFGGDRTETATPHKFEYAAKLGLGFAAVAVTEHNDFRFALLRDGVERLDRSRSTHGELLRLVDACNETDPAGEVDLRRACEAYAATIDSKALVLVAGDFLADPAEIEAGLAAFERSSLTVAQTLSPAELDPPAQGETVFRNPERDSQVRTYFGPRVASRYRDRLDDHTAAVEAAAERLGARHVAVDTGDPFFESFDAVWVE